MPITTRQDLDTITFSTAGTFVTKPVQVLDADGVTIYGKLTGLNTSTTNTVRVYYQTSPDGVLWSDMANYAYTTANTNATMNQAVVTRRLRLTSVSNVRVAESTLTTEGTVADNSTNNAPLGAYVRVKIVTAGTPSGTFSGFVLGYQ